MAGIMHEPRIARDEYDAIAALLNGEFPDTYDRWLEGCAQERKKALAQGRTVNEVDVDAQSFADYCRRIGQDASVYVFNAYVIAKSRKP